MPWPAKNKPRSGRRKIGSTKRANRRKNRKQGKKKRMGGDGRTQGGKEKGNGCGLIGVSRWLWQALCLFFH